MPAGAVRSSRAQSLSSLAVLVVLVLVAVGVCSSRTATTP
jgi:hypothetical protein